MYSDKTNQTHIMAFNVVCLSVNLSLLNPASHRSHVSAYAYFSLI